MKRNEMNTRKPKFKLPADFREDEERIPISARLRKSSHDDLYKLAKSNKLKVATLIEHAVESYIDWVKKSEATDE